MIAPATIGERSATRWTWVGMSLTALLLFFSFSPVGHPFLAFVALVPAALATALEPDGRVWRRASFLTSWALWIALLVWLRHVDPPLGWLGLILLTAYCALYPFLWLWALRWIFPACTTTGLLTRLLAMLGLAGAWGLLEWTRATFATGFGWLPLAASQIDNKVMLRLCPWVGPYGLSIALVLVNLGIARWILRLVQSYREDAQLVPVGPMGWLRRLTPELYLGLLPIALAFVALFQEISLTGTEPAFSKTVTVNIVQTDFDPNAKWNPERLQNHLQIISDLTLGAKGDEPDLILWPEAALPLTLGSEPYRERLTSLAKATGATLMIGAIEPRGNGYANGVVTITREGPQKPTYAKRHLVPFGEYVPFADFLPLRKLVPIEEDCVAGTAASLLPVTTRRGDTFLAGALVCYEDVFPELAREHAQAGAQLLVVLTNDAWYGREAGAYQHAAHSVLLAASTRLPVIRCGNAGWSGSVDRYGHAFAATQDGSIYFRGQKALKPVRILQADRPSFWVRHGDWAVGVGGVCFAWTYLWRRRRGRATVGP